MYAVLAEGGVAVGVYSNSGKEEWMCMVLAEEGIAVVV